MTGRDSDFVGLLAYTIISLLFLGASVGVVAAFRDHGITSCEERGGTPVVSSWFSESNWDVRCIND
jgi:hypothetical protein